MPVPEEFRDTSTVSPGMFMFMTTLVSMTAFGGDTEYIRISEIAGRTGTDDVQEAYRKYVPYVIRLRLEKTLPYPEAVSCAVDGTVRIVHYKKFMP